MKSESQLTKHNFLDLADQPAAESVLLLTISTMVSGSPFSYQAPFRVDRVEDDENTAVVTAYRGEQEVVRFSPDHSYLVVNADYLETYTVAEARESARQDIVDRVHVAKDQMRVYEAAKEGTDLQQRYPAPPLFTHESTQPEDGPSLDNPPRPFDPDKWLDEQMGWGDGEAK